MMWNWNGWSGIGPGWWFVHVFFLALLIGGSVFLLRGRQFRPDRSMTILRERYARGEISKHEFEQMKKDVEVR